MSERIDPAEAHARMTGANGGVTYVDVRSEAEFALGHPKGAQNVPIALPASPANDAAFVALVQMYFSADDPLIVGCASGKRSARAAALLEAAGFTRVADQIEGYEGQRDAFGSRVVPGWSGAKLPRETGASTKPLPLQRRAPRS